VYGNPEIQTPNLDRLAAQGTLFTQFYAAGSTCSPARSALVTGQWPAKTKILRPLGTHELNQQMNIPDFLDPATPILMRQLKQAGYATGHFGKWHLGGTPESPPPPAYGVDEYKVDMPGIPPEHRAYPFSPPHRGHVTEADRYIFDDGIKFIEAHRDVPFYLNLWSHTPHIPLYPSEEMMAPYRHLRPKNHPWPLVKEVYYGAVTNMDRHIGRFLKRLGELGLAENTVVIFSSDQGPDDIHLDGAGWSGIGSTGPFRGHKASIYEGGVRVPFLVRWPGHVPSGRVDDASIIDGVDFFPTLCRLAKVDLPASVQPALDGEDVGDILLGASRPRRTTLYWENMFCYYSNRNDPVIHDSPALAIREGDWKLLMNFDGTRKELYNIPHDPSEVDNKMDVQAEVGQRLADQLLKWSQSLPKGPRSIPADIGDNKYPWPTPHSVETINKHRGPDWATEEVKTQTEQPAGSP
jgi:arylsulfatase A-like enzyme